MPGDDFMVWPVHVELEARLSSEDPAVVAVTAAALECLWHSDRDAVAACDYEDELPWGGGARRPRTGS